MYSKAIVYSKSNCPYCDRAVQELGRRGIPIEKLILDEHFSIDELKSLIPLAKTFPQIFLTYSDGNVEYIGSFQQLMKKFGS